MINSFVEDPKGTNYHNEYNPPYMLINSPDLQHLLVKSCNDDKYIVKWGEVGGLAELRAFNENIYDIEGHRVMTLGGDIIIIDIDALISMVLHLINSNVYRVNDYRQSKRLEAMVSKSPLFHFVPHISTMDTWKCEYLCEIVVSPVRVILIVSGPLFGGVNNVVPDRCVVGIGLSSDAFITFD